MNKPGTIRILIALLLLLCLIEGAAAVTVVVAAQDSSALSKASAQFICDGSGDQEQIKAAIASLPWSGGTVLLREGTYHCTDNIVPGAYTTLKGEGVDRTIIDIQGYYMGIKVDQPYITLQDFTITGRGWVRITASHIQVRNVAARDALHGYYPGKFEDMGANGAFFVWADNRVVEDIEFNQCSATNIGTHGFNLNGQGTPKMIKNIRFIDCSATLCGDADGHPWATGFDFHEANDLVDCQVIRCVADNNWESGFHFEPGNLQQNVVMTDCLSTNNGQRNTNDGDFTVQPPVPAHFYMAGYTVAMGTTLNNCRSINNRNYGFYDEQDGDNIFNGCTDIGSGYGWKLCKDVEDVQLNDCISVDAQHWALWIAYARNIQVRGFEQYDTAGRTDISPQVQSMLGYYKGESAYEKPVTGSYFDITAHGSTLPILNLDDAYNSQANGNTYSLKTSNTTYVAPVITLAPTPTLPPEQAVDPVPLATPTIQDPIPVPGMIEAENYLPGAEVGFHDTTSGNDGSVYRFDDVDVERLADGSGYNVGFIRSGEWLKYNITAQTAGVYTLDFRVASPFSDRSFTFQVDGMEAGGVTVPKTGSYDTYTTVRTQVYLGAGPHQLRLAFNNADNTNLDSINVISVSGGSPTPTPTGTVLTTVTTMPPTTPTMPTIPGHTLPTRIEAKDFDLGGEGVAYHDTTPGNQGGAYRPDDVDISGSASEGSDVITGIAPGEWVRYSVTIPSGGIYTASFRVAGINGGTRFGVQLDGADISLISVPDTGSLDQFTTVKRMVWLPSGNHTLELTFNDPMAIGSIDLQSLTAPTPTPTSTTPVPTTVPTGTVPVNTTTPIPTPTVNQTPNQTPSSGAYIQHTFPTRIEAEDYDYGGQGVGYYDLTPEEEIPMYRSDGVDIGYSQSRGSYYVIADVDGEWLAYTVTIPSSGIYTLAFDLASSRPSACSLEVDNTSVCSIVGLETGSMTAFQEVRRQAWLPAGTSTLKLNFAGPMAVNAIDVWPSSGPAPTFTTRPEVTPPATPVTTTPAATPTTNVTPTTTVTVTQTTNATPTIPPTPVTTLTTVVPTTSTTAPTPTPTVTAAPPYQLGLAHQIPSRIEAEDFDLGGEGVAYHDTTAGNDGGQYRTSEGVDIEYNPTEQNYNIGWVFPGEWTRYTVNVTAAGTYTADFRVSTAWNGISLVMMLDDNPTPLTTVEVPNTGSYGTYTTVHKTVALPAGLHRIKLIFNGYENINYLEFTPSGTPVTTPTTLVPVTTPPTTVPTATIPTTVSTTVPTTVPTTIGTPGSTTSPYRQHTLPARIEAEDFDNGGEGLAYHDTTPLNEGGQYRPGDGVDIEYSQQEKSYNIGWIRDSEWLIYTVNAPVAGVYTTTFRVATPGLGRQVQVSVDGAPAATVGIPTSSSFDLYQDVVARVSLPAGTHQLRLLLKGGSMNLNYITITAPAGPVTTQTTIQPSTTIPTTPPTTVPTTIPTTIGTPGSITSPYQQHTLPVRIEAEDFDNGGEGYAYHDTTPQNEGGQYRPGDGVDIEYSQQEKSYDVGWIRDGEWLLYTVNVPTAGTYTTTFRAAVPTAGAHIRMQVDGSDLADPTLTRTGSFEAFSDTVVQVSLSAGTHTIKLLPGGGSMNLNYFTFSAAQQPTQTPTQAISTILTMPPVTPTTTVTQVSTYKGTPFRPHVLPARIEAEDYDLGGETVAYHDLTSQNEGGAYRSDGVDIEYNAGERSFDVGWVRNGEWLTYTVTSGAARTYTGSFRVATPTTGKQIRVSVDNTDVGVVTIPATGGFNQFSTVTTGIPLTPGIHQVRLTLVGDELNFNYFELT
jgi:hypothetical protein